jgi:membrane-bound serine protease (ClpP class)
MDEWVKISIIYAGGVMVLLADLILPSQGILVVIGLGLFAYGLFEAFQIGITFGIINAIVLLIALPTGFMIAIRNWHRTPIGRRISPPNPTLTPQDRLPISDLESLLGATGKAMTFLRPVGICEFNGKRFECKAEYGVIAAGVEVEAVRLSARSVVVRPLHALEGTPVT